MYLSFISVFRFPVSQFPNFLISQLPNSTFVLPKPIANSVHDALDSTLNFPHRLRVCRTHGRSTTPHTPQATPRVWGHVRQPVLLSVGHPATLESSSSLRLFRIDRHIQSDLAHTLSSHRTVQRFFAPSALCAVARMNGRSAAPPDATQHEQGRSTNDL